MGDGHTEAIKLEYDPTQTSYDELLDSFWQQYRGGGGKAQYKSAIWYHSEEQKQAIERSLDRVAQRTGRLPAVDVLPASEWHDAEDYHQKYVEKQSRGPSFYRG